VIRITLLRHGVVGVDAKDMSQNIPVRAFEEKVVKGACLTLSTQGLASLTSSYAFVLFA
jgi:hypothetical protein